ncbi:hypothetical protein HNQ51_002232 [Inhella inkyongensis]|uniref:Uncharacterized protein n=1 Tax=Inhella inkyongensis TaxID=392593 RepID=A0A840S5D5_9BURK|nr:hypothetical protein [Inhella inkyongensis]MBB5204913.1 hypothetical protein [Inhella inkyongensis]
MEGPEAHAHHHGHSGHRWLDIAAAGCAIVVSVISLFLAIHHGQVMKEMADANARMVTATSWPWVSTATGNMTGQGEFAITLSVMNKGVGPARIQGIEMRYGDKVIASAQELLKLCCGDPREAGRRDFVDITSTVNGEVLAPGERIEMLRVPREGSNREAWELLNKERFKVKTRVCYCSVFDECWITRPDASEVDKVQACPADWKKFQG